MPGDHEKPVRRDATVSAERDRLDITDGQIDLSAVRALRAHITRAVEAARASTRPPLGRVP